MCIPTYEDKKLNSAEEAIGELASLVFAIEDDKSFTSITKTYKFTCGQSFTVTVIKNPTIQ
jgi:hypothetical protein